MASRVRESASEVKLRVSALMSVAVIVSFKILVPVIQPVQFKALVTVRVLIEAESKTTVLPLKERVKEEESKTVLASRVSESVNEVKFKLSALRSDPVIVPSRILPEFTTPVPMIWFVMVRVDIDAESNTTALLPLKLKVKLEEERMVLASRTKESLNSVKSSESGVGVAQPVQLVTLRVVILAESKT